MNRGPDPVAPHEFDAALRAERDAYLAELWSDLSGIEELILSLTTPNGAAERRGRLAREIHSIKGAAGGYGLTLVSTAAHRMEDDLARPDWADDREQFATRLIGHKDRLSQLVRAYADDDAQALADLAKQYDQRADEPAGTTTPPIGRVLIIDTSRSTLRICQAALRTRGVRHLADAQDGYQALGRLLKEPFELVITALHMPTIDGQSLIAVLRLLPGPNRRTPVVLVTSSKTAIDPRGAQPDHVVEKRPTMPQQLDRFLRNFRGASSPDATPAAESGAGMLRKVVVIDDRPEIHDLLRLSFTRFPEVEIAGLDDPTKAVAFLRAEQPDMVLLDVNMPQMSGTAVFDQIAGCDDLRDIPVAFLTADESPDSRRGLEELGAWRVFKKPFAPRTFGEELVASYRNGTVTARPRR